MYVKITCFRGPCIRNACIHFIRECSLKFKDQFRPSFFFFLNETHCVLTSKVFTDIEFLTRTLILNFQLDTFNQFQGKIYLLQQYFSNLKISLDKVFFFFSSMENIKILSTILCQLIFKIVIAARTSWRS